MKSGTFEEFGEMPMSLPARGVWVEIVMYRVYAKYQGASLPARGVWVEIIYCG